MTSITKDRRISITAAGPAIENISLPAAATSLSPKTGDATKNAPSSCSRSAADAHVSGCTVDVSTNILSFNEQLADRAFVNSSFKTASFDIYTSARKKLLVIRDQNTGVMQTIVKIISDFRTRLSKSFSGSAPASSSG